MEKLLTTEEVAEYLRVDVVTIRRLINRGELTAYRIAGEFRFIEPDIEDFVKRQRVPAGNKDNKEPFRLFTERARKAMALAVSEAQQLGHQYVGTEHILLGLANEGVGVAARVLQSFNFSVEQARTELLSILSKDQEHSPITHMIKMAFSQAGVVATGQQTGLTARAKKMIELAVKEAQELGHHYTGTEHLLLGLLREGEGLAVGMLENMGINPQELRVKTLEILKSPESATALPTTQTPPPAEDVATLIKVEGQTGTCSNCGMVNPVTNNFCPGCGKRIKMVQAD